MKQVLHIFRKDSRHFWPEILISLAITAVFVWISPVQWMKGGGSIGFSAGGGFNVLLPTLASFLVFLVPVSWFLLIPRVVHAESLVGDRQFWITRPYEWPKLIAAKVLFLLVWVCLPLFVAQCVLLVLAGFHPLSWLGGLLYNLLLVTGILALPLFALAAVTRNFARMTLTLIGTIIAAIALVVLASYLSSSNVSAPYEDHISFPLFLCFCIAAIVLQYAARRTWLSRLLLIAIPAVLVIAGFARPDASLMQRAYPRPSSPQDRIVQLSFLPDSLDKVTASAEPKGKEVLLNIPLQVSGIGDGYAITPNDAIISIEAPNGLHWTSPWQSAFNVNLLPDLNTYRFAVKINRVFYDRVRSLPVTLHLTFALTQTRAGKVTRIAMPAEKFSVPEFGICGPTTDWNHSAFMGLACIAALHQPRLTYVNVLWSNDPPSSPSAAPPNPAPSIQGAGWAGDLDPSIADFGITSVWNIQLNLSNGMRQIALNRPWEPRYLWPGTPITFTQYNLVRRTQMDITIPEFHLPDDHRQERVVFEAYP
jgi:hypothetical protein